MYDDDDVWDDDDDSEDDPEELAYMDAQLKLPNWYRLDEDNNPVPCDIYESHNPRHTIGDDQRGPYVVITEFCTSKVYERRS
jgi:hypothetical protein